MQTPRIASRIDSSGGASDCDSFVRAEAYDRNKLLYCRWDLMISTQYDKEIKADPSMCPVMDYLFIHDVMVYQFILCNFYAGKLA